MSCAFLGFDVSAGLEMQMRSDGIGCAKRESFVIRGEAPFLHVGRDIS